MDNTEWLTVLLKIQQSRTNSHNYVLHRTASLEDRSYRKLNLKYFEISITITGNGTTHQSSQSLKQHENTESVCQFLQAH